jgi:hypothetical protein
LLVIYLNEKMATANAYNYISIHPKK